MVVNKIEYILGKGVNPRVYNPKWKTIVGNKHFSSFRRVTDTEDAFILAQNLILNSFGGSEKYILSDKVVSFWPRLTDIC